MLKRIQKRKQKRNRFLMGFALIFFMVFGMLGVLNSNKENEGYEYNDYKFEWNGQTFTTKINGETRQFYTIPQELEDINRSIEFDYAMKAPAFYLTFEPNQEQTNLVYLDILRNDLANNFDTYVVSTITEESNTYELPIVTCNNATPETPVLFVQISNITNIETEGSCIIIKSKLTDVFRIRDLMIYTHYGVINE